MVSKYLKAVLALVIAVTTYGSAVPALVSYPDDLAVYLGILLGLVIAPIGLYSLIASIFKTPKKEKES